MDTDYLKEAIDAVKALLINALNNEEYCSARSIGGALEILINQKNKIPQPTSRGIETGIGQCSESPQVERK